MLAAGGTALVLSFFTARDDAATDATALEEVVPGTVPKATERTYPQELPPGNVVVRAPTREIATQLEALADEIAGGPSFSPALRKAGQAIEIRTTRASDTIVAAAATREYTATGPDDPGLREFIEFWLGRDDEKPGG